MRRLALLLTGGAVWLFLAAVPAFADGGPHISTVNSGTSGLTADTCAGCHRAHQAEFEYLLVDDGETATCLTCHNGTGATTDVEDGIQYVPNADGSPSGVVLGALRNGGFHNARIDSANAQRIAYKSSRGVSIWSKVPVKATGQAVTSAHITGDGLNSLAQPGTLWGSGASTASAANAGEADVDMSCVSCHNPHGNGQYRILNDFKGAYGPPTGFPTVYVAQTYASGNVIATKNSHGFQPGDLVTISNLAGAGVANGQYVVLSVPNAIQLTVGAYNVTTGAWTTTATTVTANVAGTDGTTIVRHATPVADVPVGTPTNDVYPTKNYTVKQVLGTQGNPGSGWLWYASDLTGAYADISGGDYFRRNVPWSLCTTDTTTNVEACAAGGPSGTQKWDAPNGRPDFSTSLQHAAFNTQMTVWCSACHTRYFVNGNPNPTYLEGSSAATAKYWSISTTGSSITASSHGFVVGDRVQFDTTSGTATPTLTTADYWYVVAVGSTSTFSVSSTLNGSAQSFTVSGTVRGTVIRPAPQTANGWWFPRLVDGTTAASDGTYKFQHSTTQNRTCTTCHVAHGSNAQMSGRFSTGQTYPGSEDEVGTNSFLLKADNRGTCQLCHDPTGTVTAGQYYPLTLVPSTP